MKKPCSSFFQFINEKRDALRAANPQVRFAEVSKILAEEWRLLSETQKKKYEDFAAQDKIRYLEELKITGSKIPKSLKQKDDSPKGPKHAQSSYMIFGNELRLIL